MDDFKTFFYAAIGAQLQCYDVDVDAARLTPRDTIRLPAKVQYCWPHPSRPYLYVVSSDGGPRMDGDMHAAAAFEIGPNTGALTPAGAPAALRARPIHCTVDTLGQYLLCAYNYPSGASVHQLHEDGSIGAPVAQPETLDTGVYAHQIRTLPSNRGAIVVARGNDGVKDQPEDPGGLMVYDFANGRLSPKACIAPNSGYGFGPRHLDFHLNGRWVYVSVERQDQLHLFELGPNDQLSDTATFVVDSLKAPQARQGPQLACAVHVHPNGQFVYQANRTDRLARSDGWRVSHGGEDNLVVYAINQNTGEPSPIQHIDTGSIHARTFSIHPSGKLLVAATIQAVPTLAANNDVRLIPAALLLYRIDNNGHLTLARTYEMDTRGELMFWTGMVSVR